MKIVSLISDNHYYDDQYISVIIITYTFSFHEHLIFWYCYENTKLYMNNNL